MMKRHFLVRLALACVLVIASIEMVPAAALSGMSTGLSIGASVSAAPSLYVLTVTRPTGGTVQSAGILCGTSGSTCQVVQPSAMWLGLLATPDPGYEFTSWTGDCAGSAASVTVALTSPRTCGATFTPVTNAPVAGAAVSNTTAPTLALAGVSGSTGGPYTFMPVRSAGGTIRSIGTNCFVGGGDCFVTMSRPTTISVTAIPNPGFAFVGWTGNCTGTAPALALVIDGPKVCGATFAADTGSGTGSAGKTTPAVTWPAPAPITEGTPLGPVQLNASAGGIAGSFAYSPQAGTVLAAGTHTLSAIFTPTDPTRYNPVTATRSLTVKAAVTVKTTPVITWPAPAPILEGTALGAAQLNASTTVAGSWAYTPQAGTVLAPGTHTLTVVFTPSDTALYNTATASRSLTVTAKPLKTTPVITWPAPAPITEGTPLGATQLNASTTVPGSFAYTPQAGTVLAAGTHTLSVVFTPSDTTLYNTATATRSLTVTAKPLKTTPVITWPTPAPITEGTALGATQLNASTTVPGSFVYTPQAGTVLAAGTHTLSTVFTPSDSTRYNTAAATRTLVVYPVKQDEGGPRDPVSIRLERVADGPDVISFGLPLARGTAADTSTIHVYAGTRPVDARLKPLLYDYDATGSPAGLRAVLVQFPASVMTGQSLTVTVTFREAGPVPSADTVPFADVSVESAETAAVADRTIVQEGQTYRLQESNTRRVTLFTSREPAVLAHFPQGYLAQSGVLGPQLSAADVAADPNLAGLRFLSENLNPFVRSAVFEEEYALNPATNSVTNPVTNFEGWLYDRCATLLTASVHAGDPAVLRHGLRNCSFYGSKIVLDGTYRGYWAGKPSWDSKYSHARGLFAYYALTGDEAALAAVHAIADLWNTDPFMIGPYRRGSIRGVDKLWTERLLGTGLEGLFYGFRLTGDRKYLTAFQEVVTTAYRHITTEDQAELVTINKDPNQPPFPPQGCWIHNASQHAEGNISEPWCSSWMSELVIESLLAYQAQTNDPRVDEIFVRLARFLRDTGTSYFYKATVLNDFFLKPSVAYNLLDGSSRRRLVPLYGAALTADMSRVSYGDYSDFEHCPDATALTAVALRALVRQGTYDLGGPIGPFANEGESFLALHHELSSCAQRTIAVRVNPAHDPRTWTSAKLAAGVGDPAAFIAQWGIGYPSHVTSPQRKLSWWFNSSMLQFAVLREAGIKVPDLQPGLVQPK